MHYSIIALLWIKSQTLPCQQHNNNITLEVTWIELEADYCLNIETFNVWRKI